MKKSDNLFDLDRAKMYAKMRSFDETETAAKWNQIENLSDSQLKKVIETAKTTRGVNIRMSKIAAQLQDNSEKRDEFQRKTQEIVDSAV